MTSGQYTGVEVYQLLVDNSEAGYIVQEWAERNLEFDMRIRRAKTQGKTVVELKDPIFASRIMQFYGAKVHIKKSNKQ